MHQQIVFPSFRKSQSACKWPWFILETRSHPVATSLDRLEAAIRTPEGKASLRLSLTPLSALARPSASASNILSHPCFLRTDIPRMSKCSESPYPHWPHKDPFPGWPVYSPSFKGSLCEPSLPPPTPQVALHLISLWPHYLHIQISHNNNK